MRTLHEVLMQERNRRLDQLPLCREQKREARRPWLAQRCGVRLRRCRRHALDHLRRIWQWCLANNLNHADLPCRQALDRIDE